MTRFVRTLALTSALGLLAGTAVTVADAQEKKEKKSADKKPAEKSPEKAPEKADKKGSDEKSLAAIEVYQGKNGWRYSVKGPDGKTIAMPLPQLSWESREECLKAITELKTILSTVKPTDRKE